MKNYVAKGDIIDLVAAGAITSGTPVVMTDVVGVPLISGVSGDTIPCAVEGIYELTKLTGEAWTLGQKVYWDPGAVKCTTTAGALKQIGNASAAALSGDVIGRVKLGKL
jgi:predicted RecA/RadA family phage recombinase